MAPKLCVIVASVGRAELLCLTVAHLAKQTRTPDRIIIVSVVPEDVAGIESITTLPIEIVFAEKGLPIQRNAGLRHLGQDADFVVFFDDDFVPALTYLEKLEQIFVGRPEISGVTGRLIADGIKSRGISFPQALRMIAEDLPPLTMTERFMPALYGCNLSLRLSAALDLWFDEALPLYGWQEDVDFSYQLGKRGKLLRTDALSGIHLGTKGGRTSGKRLGYSQIANPIYLLRKKTIPSQLAWRLMIKNIAANALRSLYRPEPYTDRRGRLLGNLIALGDMTSGRLHPGQVWKL